MRYGIEEEPIKAIKAYSNVLSADVSIKQSELWVNKKYPYLGASPDGLIDDSQGNLLGIIEVKCLKALKDKTVMEWINTGIETNACVSPTNDGDLLLKKNHPYYFQVQQQLLITEVQYCDFVLHCNVGHPYVIRICADLEVQNQIVENTKRFWYNVSAPEYFLMRVPRKLLPIIFE